MRLPNVRRPQNGFSLVEVLVVLGILALLMSLILRFPPGRSRTEPDLDQKQEEGQ